MEEFLTNYVKMVAESKEIELNEQKISEIVERLMNNDEMWDTFDSFVYEELEEE